MSGSGKDDREGGALGTGAGRGQPAPSRRDRDPNPAPEDLVGLCRVDPVVARGAARRLLRARSRAAVLRPVADAARQHRDQVLDRARRAVGADEEARGRAASATRRMVGAAISATGAAIVVTATESAPGLYGAVVVFLALFALALRRALRARRLADREWRASFAVLGWPSPEEVLAGELGDHWWDSSIRRQQEAEEDLRLASERWARLAGDLPPEEVETLLAQAGEAREAKAAGCALAEAAALATALEFDAARSAALPPAGPQSTGASGEERRSGRLA